MFVKLKFVEEMKEKNHRVIIQSSIDTVVVVFFKKNLTVNVIVTVDVYFVRICTQIHAIDNNLKEKNQNENHFFFIKINNFFFVFFL